VKHTFGFLTAGRGGERTGAPPHLEGHRSRLGLAALSRVGCNGLTVGLREHLFPAERCGPPGCADPERRRRVRDVGGSGRGRAERRAAPAGDAIPLDPSTLPHGHREYAPWVLVSPLRTARWFHGRPLAIQHPDPMAGYDHVTIRGQSGLTRTHGAYSRVSMRKRRRIERNRVARGRRRDARLDPAGASDIADTPPVRGPRNRAARSAPQEIDASRTRP